MTPAQIIQAQGKARQCRLQKFKRCDDLSSAQVGITASVTIPRDAMLETTQPPASVATTRKAIQLEKDGGTYGVPVVINGITTLKFTVDSGASDVSIPFDVYLTLVRAGTISDDDLLGKETYVLADGSEVKARTVRIDSLKLGDDVVVENVIASVSDVNGSLLLGQSFLGRLKSWSMDNQKHALIVE